MFFQRSIVIASIGFGLLQAGCSVGADDMGVDDIGVVGLKLLDDPNGNGGTNGLSPEEAMPNMELLWRAADSSIHSANNSAVQQLLSNDDGINTLRYAIRCALPSSRSSIVIDGHEFVGGGILSTTSGWMTGGLSLSAKEDLMTCMIAHLNPYGVEVPIKLSGDSVTNSSLAPWPSSADFHEALWVARRSSRSGGMDYIAWTFDDLANICADPGASIATRVCGRLTPLGNYEVTECDVDVRTAQNMAADCTYDDETLNWTCLGHPAIKTRLRDDLYMAPLLHPSCTDRPTRIPQR